MIRGELGSHGAAHGVSGDIPMLDLRELSNHFFCRIGIKNRHMERHMDQNAGNPGLSNLIEQRKVGLCFDFGAGIENDGGVSGGRWRKDSQIVLHRDAAVLSQDLKSHILCPVIIGHVPEKRGRQNGQDQKNDSSGNEPFFAPGRLLCLHVSITSVSIGPIKPRSSSQCP